MSAPDSTPAAAQLADAYVALNTPLSVAMALDLYAEILARDGPSDPLLGRIADANTTLGNVDAAIEASVRRARLPDGDAYAAATAITLAAASFARLDAGIVALRSVLADCDQLEVHLLLAGLHASNDEHAEAVQIVDRVIAALAADSPLAEQAHRLRKRWAR